MGEGGALSQQMKLSILAKPGSRLSSVEHREDDVWVVRVRERAVDGKANDAVVRALASHFGCPPSRVTIIRGLGSRHKVVEVTV